MSLLVGCLLLAGGVLGEGTPPLGPAPVVLTEQGYVRGVVSASGRYYEYMGIPFASLTSRFGTADPPRSWHGVFEANSDAIECFQLNGTHFVGQEDCLVLNVYVPKREPSDALLPVLTHFYGGANLFGSGSREVVQPSLLVNKEVVFVTMNFRMGAFGFLCLGVKEAPGNAAMKDQVAALKWVNQNIKAFGGDPGRVTMSGHSTGSIATSLHMLSSMSTGLFQQGITMSGTAIMSCAVDEYPVERSKKLTRLMGHVTETIEEILEVLINADPYDIVMATELSFTTSGASLPFSVCVEENIAGEKSFLSKIPYNILVSGNYTPVPIMNGFTSNEGLWISNLFDIQFVDEHFEEFVPHDLEKSPVSKKIRSFYFRDLSLEQNLQTFVDYFSDLWFTYASRTTSLLHYKTSPFPVYSYIFQYDGDSNDFKNGLQKKFSQLSGASHADELPYIFRQDVHSSELSEADLLIMDRLVTMFTNFVKYGDPTPATTATLSVKWLPMNATHENYLVIDSVMGFAEQPFRRRMQFWDGLYDQHRRNWSVVPEDKGHEQTKSALVLGIVVAVISIAVASLTWLK